MHDNKNQVISDNNENLKSYQSFQKDLKKVGDPIPQSVEIQRNSLIIIDINQNENSAQSGQGEIWSYNIKQELMLQLVNDLNLLLLQE